MFCHVPSCSPGSLMFSWFSCSHGSLIFSCPPHVLMVPSYSPGSLMFSWFPCVLFFLSCSPNSLMFSWFPHVFLVLSCSPGSLMFSCFPHILPLIFSYSLRCDVVHWSFLSGSGVKVEHAGRFFLMFCWLMRTFVNHVMLSVFLQ